MNLNTFLPTLNNCFVSNQTFLPQVRHDPARLPHQRLRRRLLRVHPQVLAIVPRPPQRPDGLLRRHVLGVGGVVQGRGEHTEARRNAGVQRAGLRGADPAGVRRAAGRLRRAVHRQRGQGGIFDCCVKLLGYTNCSNDNLKKQILTVLL